MAEGDTTLTVQFKEKPGWGGLKRVIVSMTLDDNYNTGGYNCDLTGYGLGTIILVLISGCPLGYLPEYDYTNGKLKFYVSSTGAEVADGNAALKTQTVRLMAVGKGV